MKVKLLKRLRKKYSWYFNNDKFPVLINHEKERVTVYTVKYIMDKYKWTQEDVDKGLQVSHQEWALRFMKDDLLGSYGWSMQRVNYKLAVKRFKKKHDRNNFQEGQ